MEKCMDIFSFLWFSSTSYLDFLHGLHVDATAFAVLHKGGVKGIHQDDSPQARSLLTLHTILNWYSDTGRQWFCYDQRMLCSARDQTMWDFWGSMPILILGSKKIPISDTPAEILYVISAECGYPILFTKICNGDRISYILINIPNISLISY